MIYNAIPWNHEFSIIYTFLFNFSLFPRKEMVLALRCHLWREDKRSITNETFSSVEADTMNLRLHRLEKQRSTISYYICRVTMIPNTRGQNCIRPGNCERAQINGGREEENEVEAEMDRTPSFPE